MTAQRCGTCKWLDVPPDKAGRRIPRKTHVYRCLWPLPKRVLPDSILRAYGYNPTPSRSHMTPADGQTRATWEPRQDDHDEVFLTTYRLGPRSHAASGGVIGSAAMNRLLDHLIDWWMRRCPHDDQHVAADILEGGWDRGRVKYCRRCGSVQVAYDGHPMNISEWRRPRPLWFPHGKGMR